jgi:hypothetical protein
MGYWLKVLGGAQPGWCPTPGRAGHSPGSWCSGRDDLLPPNQGALRGAKLLLALEFSPISAGDTLNASFTRLADQGAAFGGDGLDSTFNLIGSVFRGSSGVPLLSKIGLPLYGLLSMSRRDRFMRLC